MIFISHYDSPLGMIYMAADKDGLKGVWFEGQKYFASGLKENETEEKETPVLNQTREWLDLYFAGKDPKFLPLLHGSLPRPRRSLSPRGSLWSDPAGSRRYRRE